MASYRKPYRAKKAIGSNKKSIAAKICEFLTQGGYQEIDRKIEEAFMRQR
jgi:hypothetical protein